MFKISDDRPGTSQLLMGNEAIARGALEAGAQVIIGYPGTPSSEIIGTLAPIAKQTGIDVEWAINEKVATEQAAAASFAGLRSMATMKNAGMNVASDFLQHHNLSGTGKDGGGMVVVVCDDPNGHSSSDEQDTRWVAKSADVPLLAPDDAQDAKDLMKYAFEISETYKTYCVLRSCTRVSHSTGTVVVGELPSFEREAAFDSSQIITPETPFIVQLHESAHERQEKVREEFERCPFNWYEGSDKPELLIVCSGSGSPCSREAIDLLRLEDRVGVLKLATLWPFPRKLVRERLARVKQVLVVEETDPFVELHLKEIVADSPDLAGKVMVYGQGSGHMAHCGEITPDRVVRALCEFFDREYVPRDSDYAQKAQDLGSQMLAPRGAIWCPGCPHRASFWSMKEALRKDRRNGFAVGDVGCYTLDIWPYGYHVTRILHGMGTGLGLGSGFGRLGRFKFDQPVISVCGDSTFFHSSVPALMDAVHHNANMLAVVMDNNATAMTGFQPHPGSDTGAAGDAVNAIDIADFCRSLGCKVAVQDPFDIRGTTQKIGELLKDGDGVRVLIMRRTCELLRMRKERKEPYRITIDETKCKEKCTYCTEYFACPGLTLDKDTGKARIVEGVCAGCGVCVDICPSKAIAKEVVE
jgi:indolepyruvate ferredoxin oxidoreductase alpha subunit